MIRTLNYVQITEYRFLKVDYQSEVDWCIRTDYLRCNPSFHGSERRDFVLINHPRLGHFFGQLVRLFTCEVGSCDYPLALVQPLTQESSRSAETKRNDRNLSIHRWHMQPRTRCEVIPLNTIIRGALLVADKKYKGDYFVVDTVDDDMYLRIRGMRH
jgi:hypothetical protein